ncbi:uncharacterized protein FA14DRAFT_93372 [Meira miltonrushii]|uniref:Uncharacterized protein n=1 Tax=Meira miltonrushii TaxID=1280837 RepID=A0A316V2Y6_9BASI|nr:uncharacterized protein FA14DRAFT_93372 [Meira miltonrushii]PWN31822.1 hypothetical protein FA14DRAFT_93372 [Meira miltonrushii]
MCIRRDAWLFLFSVHFSHNFPKSATTSIVQPHHIIIPSIRTLTVKETLGLRSRKGIFYFLSLLTRVSPKLAYLPRHRFFTPVNSLSDAE